MYGASNVVEGTPAPPPPPPLHQRVLNSTPPPPPAPPSMNTRLTAKPHAFAGAVLSPKHARDLSPALCMAITSSLAEQNHNKATVPYTLWITEAWRVLGWAEPSAALFWEVATMYHTLQVAGRDWEQQYPGGFGGQHIPPILSCGSTSSLTSGATNATERAALEQHNKKKFSSAVSAKELPVWLVGTFLLLHCEEFARQRSLSGEDERRYYGTTASSKTADEAAAVLAGGASRIDFTSLFKHQGLSPRYVAEYVLALPLPFVCWIHLLTIHQCLFAWLGQNTPARGLEQRQHPLHRLLAASLAQDPGLVRRLAQSRSARGVHALGGPADPQRHARSSSSAVVVRLYY